MRNENKHDVFIAYLDLQNSVGGKMPPCVHCGDSVGIIRFHHCKSTGDECAAFRQYESKGKFEESDIGVRIKNNCQDDE